MITPELYYGIALSLVPRIGNISAKTLLSYCGSFENVFKANDRALLKIPGVSPAIIEHIRNFDQFDVVDREIKYIEKHNIEVYFHFSADYPRRFQPFYESPFILFKKGPASLDANRTLGIVGTRTPTPQAVQWTQDLVESLRPDKVSVISGYAFGIDITAHKAAFRNQIPTVAVLAGGLEMIYPAGHRRYLDELTEHGALITEFYSRMPPDKQRFPMRNRLIAALADGTLVVESAIKGGSMITADIAFGYNKPVMAVPGSPGMKYSEGCNHLIRSQKAELVSSREHILETMNWDIAQVSIQQQATLFRELSEQEAALLELLRGRKDMGVDEIRLRLGMKSNEFASLLITLDLDGFISQLPGNRVMVR